jgi:hypothetical protein
MRPPALVPQHVPLAEAARIARRHGFVLRAVEHEGQVRIAMVRPGSAPAGAVADPGASVEDGGAATPASPDAASPSGRMPKSRLD